MSEDTTVNGWANYPTFAVGIWFDNDERLQGECTRICEERGTVAASAGALKELLEEEIDGLGDGTVARDLLDYAIACVDWHEIAEHFGAVDRSDDEDEDDGIIFIGTVGQFLDEITGEPADPDPDGADQANEDLDLRVGKGAAPEEE